MSPVVDLVIARYDEDVSWIRDVLTRFAHTRVHVFVYDKGVSDLDASALPDASLTVVRLPNVGRESHTYLEHVIRMRDAGTCTSAEAVTVFLQGRMDDHVPLPCLDIHSFVMSMVSEASEEGGLGESRNRQCHTQYGTFNAHPDMRVAMYPDVGDSGMDLRHWFMTVLGAGPWRWDRVQDGPGWWQHGVFAIRTSRLLSSDSRVDDDYYSALRAQVDWHINPEAGHYFERSWCFVFPPLGPSGSGGER